MSKTYLHSPPADPARTADADHWHAAASNHHRARRGAEALRAAQRGSMIDPGRAAFPSLEAYARNRTGDTAGAYRCLVRALRLDPALVTGWRLLGVLWYTAQRYDRAWSASRRALLLNPADGNAAKNLAQLAKRSGEWRSAVDLGRWACACRPGDPDAAFELGMLYLGLGRWRDGWPLYDRRIQVRGARPAPDRFAAPFWEGRRDPDLSLLVWCDQNVGDEMQFARLLPQVADRVGRLVLECDPRLVPLFARSFPGIEAVARADPPDPRLTAGDIDAQIPQGHLGGLLLPDRAAFERGPRRWLAADPDRVRTFRDRYRSWSAGRPVVGLAWHSANRKFQGKNIPLPQWRPVLDGADCLFLSLQYGDVDDDLAAARTATGFAIAQDPEVDPLRDLDGFAAQLEAVDLVISISNSTIHQACGLGRPVWGLLHVRPDWRWGYAGDDCPWFPSLRLFRQTARGQWDPVLRQVGTALREWLAAGAAA